MVLVVIALDSVLQRESIIALVSTIPRSSVNRTQKSRNLELRSFCNLAPRPTDLNSQGSRACGVKHTFHHSLLRR